MFKMLIFSKLKSFSHQAKESVRGGGHFCGPKRTQQPTMGIHTTNTNTSTPLFAAFGKRLLCRASTKRAAFTARRGQATPSQCPGTFFTENVLCG